MIIYVRIDKKHKVIQFHRTWEDARSKSGKVKKFDSEHRYKILNEVKKEWRGITSTELNRWTAPDWIKEWAEKRFKTSIYVTQVNGIVYYMIDGDSTPTTINKENTFMKLYNINDYLYGLVKSIAEFHEIDKLTVYTDIADLLRLNRIYYKVSKNEKVIIKLMSYNNIYEKMNWRYQYNG